MIRCQHPTCSYEATVGLNARNMDTEDSEDPKTDEIVKWHLCPLCMKRYVEIIETIQGGDFDITYHDIPRGK
mgnify:CR=1 FL=1